MQKLRHLPWKASWLHVIGQCNIMWPHIKLPLAKANHTAEHIARVHANSHVYFHTCGLPYLPGGVSQQYLSSLLLKDVSIGRKQSEDDITVKSTVLFICVKFQQNKYFLDFRFELTQ